VRYNVGVAYLLWLFSGCGALGFHRFYLGKVGTGILWFFIGGLCGLGCVFDAITLPRQVQEANIGARVRAEMGYENGRGLPLYGQDVAPKPENPEKTVLRVAQKKRWVRKPGRGRPRRRYDRGPSPKAPREDGRFGNAEMRVRSSGVIVYFFPEFARDGRDDFAV